MPLFAPSGPGPLLEAWSPQRALPGVYPSVPLACVVVTLVAVTCWKPKTSLRLLRLVRLSRLR